MPVWMGYLQATGGRQLAFYGWPCGGLIGESLLYYLTCVIKVVTCHAKTPTLGRDGKAPESGILLDPTKTSRVNDLPNPIRLDFTNIGVCSFLQIKSCEFFIFLIVSCINK